MRKIETVFIERSKDGKSFVAILYVNKRRAVLSKTRRLEPLIRFACEAGYRVIVDDGCNERGPSVTTENQPR